MPERSVEALAVIEFRGATKVFVDQRGGEVLAVDELDLCVAEGETHCLIGTSGCGKTTALKMVNRMVEPTRGSLLLGGVEVTSMEVIALRRRIGWVIQTGGLFPHMTVSANIGLLPTLEGHSKRQIERRVAELLELVDLPVAEFAHRLPAELSGGQRQRVGVARALALDPEYVLMDEPLGALDPITRSQLQEQLAQLKQRMHKTILLVTHDLGEAFLLGDRVSIMRAGRLVQTGTESELRTNPAEEFVSQFLASHNPGPVAGV